MPETRNKQKGSALRFVLPTDTATRQCVDETSSNFALPVHWWWGSGYHSDLISTTSSHYWRATFENRAISTAKGYWHTGNRPIKTRWTQTSQHAWCVQGFPPAMLSSDHIHSAHFLALCQSLESILHCMCGCEPSMPLFVQSSVTVCLSCLCKHSLLEVGDTVTLWSYPAHIFPVPWSSRITQLAG